MNHKRIIILGNYQPDNQKSMQKYAQTLKKIASNTYNVDIVYPKEVLGKLAKYFPKGKKILGYIDKYILFPISFILANYNYDLVHICDHSNAVYGLLLPQDKYLVTCHDVLAIKGAFGDKDSYCPASRLGILLQKSILYSLKKCRNIIAVSQKTKEDLLSLCKDKEDIDIKVILNPLNNDFIVEPTAHKEHQKVKLIEEDFKYLLMVGSGLPRKNRETAIKVIDQLKHLNKYKLLIAGAPLTTEQKEIIGSLRIEDIVINIVNPSHDYLNALYNNAYALLFCSYSEGFGWPIIEAQACCCPVIASDQSAVPEIAGLGALTCNPNDTQSIINYIIKLENQSFRDDTIKKGLENLKRFNFNLIRDQYLQSYDDVLKKKWI